VSAEAAERTARLAVRGVTAASFATPMMLAGVNVAVPQIGGAFALDAVLASWIPLAYLLAATVTLLPAGRIADLAGRKRVFTLGLALAVAGSAGAWAAPGFASLLAMRIVQGLGAGMIFANSAAILSSAVAPARRGRAIGAAASAVYLGLCVGPMLAGWTVDAFGWRAALIVHTPIQLAALALMLALPGDWRAERPARFDAAGATLFALAIGCLALGVSMLPAARGVLLAAVAVVAFAGFVREQAGRADPLIDVGLFRRNRLFAFSCAAALASYAATFGIGFLLSIYLQDIRGLAAGATGLVLAVQPAMMALLSPLAGRSSDSREPRRLATAGMGMITLGLLALAAIAAHTSLAWILAALVLVGTGFALFSAPNINAIMGAVEPRQYGIASATNATTRTLGQLLAMGLVTLVFAVQLGDAAVQAAAPAAVLAGIRICFLVAAATCLAGMAFSAARGRAHAA